MSGKDTVGRLRFGLESATAAGGGAGARDVARRWNPPFCGDMDLLIKRDGSWIHEGRPIRRKAMRVLFASILRIEDGEYYLVNPVEKVRIQVEDCPFLIDRMTVRGSGEEQLITMVTDLDEAVAVDAGHPLRVDTNRADGQPHPRVMVRDGLWGLVNRSVFYELAALAEERQEGNEVVMGVRSAGGWFQLGRCPADEMPVA